MAIIVSERLKRRLRYHRRLEAEFVRNTLHAEMEKAQKKAEQFLKEKELAQKKTEQFLKEKELAQNETERLLLLLKKAGIDPNQTIG